MLIASPHPAVVDFDGKTVWVNGGDGCCIGRFSKWGIDVHHGYEAQASGGKQCIDCTHSKPDIAGWRQFQDQVLKHHGVAVPNEAMPVFLNEISL